MSRNCRERTADIAAIKQVSEWHFQKITITLTEVVLIQMIRKSFLPFKLYTIYPQEKSSHKKYHVYLTDSQYSTCLLKKCPRLQHLLQSGDLKSRKTSDVFFWLIFLVSSPLSMTILIYIHR